MENGGNRHDRQASTHGGEKITKTIGGLFIYHNLRVCFCTQPDPHYITTAWNTVSSPRSPVSSVGSFRL